MTTAIDTAREPEASFRTRFTSMHSRSENEGGDSMSLAGNINVRLL